MSEALKHGLRDSERTQLHKTWPEIFKKIQIGFGKNFKDIKHSQKDLKNISR
jgi:hypothetical protein